MDHWVSKFRTKKAKSRLKKGKRLSGRVDLPLLQRPSIGLSIALLSWWAMSVLLSLDYGPSTTPVIGPASFLLISFGICGLMLHMLQPDILRRNAALLLIIVLATVQACAAHLLLWAYHMGTLSDLSLLTFATPFALAALLGTILVNSRVGITVGLWSSFIVIVFMVHSVPGILESHALPLISVALISIFVSAAVSRSVRKRTHIFRIGLIIGGVNTLVVLVLAIARLHSIEQLGTQVLVCLMTGIGTAIAALLLLPVLESVFRITTDLRLLELSDLGHPLLRQMSLEAPGTYHHSQMIAQLASQAAEEIGANALMARVCSYFHDIGKLTKPEFFTENIQFRENPHDELSPSMSTLIIMSHVKEGVSMAMSHKLPQPVIDVIREHHGTSLVQFFHHKARQLQKSQAENEKTTVSESDFRYPGPRPRTRESAIIALADSIEAASRSLEKTSPSHIENLVNEIVTEKVEDNQLDLCDLTFADLTKVKRSFIFTLTNMLHGRIAYPKDEDLDEQPAEGTSSTDGAPETPDTLFQPENGAA